MLAGVLRKRATHTGVLRTQTTLGTLLQWLNWRTILSLGGPMQGTIIEINREKDYCVVNNPDQAETYEASLGELKGDLNLVVGSDCEIEVSKAPSFFAHGKAKLLSCQALEFKNTKVALTTEARLPEHEILQENSDYFIAAEGGSERECRAAITERAIECHANALLGLKLETVVRPGVKTVLYRYIARPAIIEGPQYHQEPGIGLDIPTKVARRNSPNEAMVRYIRVLLICFLFIAIPCVLSMTQGGMIPSPLMGQIITAGLLVMCMVLFMFISFKKKQSYILVNKHSHRRK